MNGDPKRTPLSLLQFITINNEAKGIEGYDQTLFLKTLEALLAKDLITFDPISDAITENQFHVVWTTAGIIVEEIKPGTFLPNSYNKKMFQKALETLIQKGVVIPTSAQNK